MGSGFLAPLVLIAFMVGSAGAYFPVEVKSTTCYCGVQLQGSVSNADCRSACGGRERAPWVRDEDAQPPTPTLPPPPPPPPEAPPSIRAEGKRLSAAAVVGVRSALRDVGTARLARAGPVLRAAGSTTAGRAAVFVAPRLLGVGGSVLLAYDLYRVARNFYARRERKKRGADPAESRYGLCSKKQQRELQRRVDRGECSRKRNCMKLVGAMPLRRTVLDRPERMWHEFCTAIRQRIDMFRQCIQDRDAVMRTCYREQPKDSERWKHHEQQIETNRQGIENCNKFLANFGCGGP